MNHIPPEAGNVWYDDPIPPLTTAEKVEFIAAYAFGAAFSLCAVAALIVWVVQ